MRRHPFDTRSPFGLDSPFGPRGGGAAAEFATLFDGTNDFATYSSTPTGLSTTGPAFTYSTFFRIDTAGQFHGIFGTPSTTNIAFLVRSSNTAQVDVKDTAGGSVISHVNVGPADMADGNVHHAIFSADRTNNRTQFVLDGLTRINTTYPTANDIAIMGASIAIMNALGFKAHGAVWETWWDDRGYDVVTNLTTWRNADGTPADLGADGSAPGAQPVGYFPDGNPADNKGTGGNATVTGAPTQIVRPT